MAPDNFVAHAALHTAFHLKGMYEEALTEAKASYAAVGDREVEQALVRGYAEAGYQGAMSLAADTLAARSNYNGRMDIAALYAYAGKKDRSLEWLEKAFEAREPGVPYLGVLPLYDSLRDDPRFQDLLRRMDLPVS